MSLRPEKENLVYHDHPQGSPEWLACRNNYITASAISKIMKPGTAEYRNLLLEKASSGEYRTFFGTEATRWGHKYEPVANAIFEYRHRSQSQPQSQDICVYDYGLIHNPKYPYLAASPDGITNYHEMLEIKCPYSRKIDGIIKQEYRQQIQQQLWVCECDICNFLECKFVEVEREQFFHILTETEKNTEKGIIIQSEEGNDRYNYYSPIELCERPDDLRIWYEQRLEDIGHLNGWVVKESFWLLEKYNLQQVKKDPTWYENIKWAVDKFWSEVEKHRSNGDSWKQLLTESQSSRLNSSSNSNSNSKQSNQSDHSNDTPKTNSNYQRKSVKLPSKCLL